MLYIYILTLTFNTMKVRTVKAALTVLNNFGDYIKLVNGFGISKPMYITKEKHELDIEPAITYVNITREINYQVSDLKPIEVRTVGELKEVLSKMPAKGILRTQHRIFIDPKTEGQLIDNIVSIAGDYEGVYIG